MSPTVCFRRLTEEEYSGVTETETNDGGDSGGGGGGVARSNRASE